MTNTSADMLTFEDIVEILEEEIEKYELDNPCEELDFNDPCNENI